MRQSIPLLIAALFAIAPAAQAQSVASRPAVTHGSKTAHSARPAHKQHAQAAREPAARAHATAASAAAGGVLSLGASDITGNKELPKVMVIVPWKDSLGAGGVIKPTDSLLDEVLQPVDRGVFQRQVRYYGQLGTAAGQPTAARVAPVGDSH
ncbi:MAG: hypothetical protein ACREVO_09770 [Steroidobacteraceae bacterium]